MLPHCFRQEIYIFERTTIIRIIKFEIFEINVIYWQTVIGCLEQSIISRWQTNLNSQMSAIEDRLWLSRRASFKTDHWPFKLLCISG